MDMKLNAVEGPTTQHQHQPQRSVRQSLGGCHRNAGFVQSSAIVAGYRQGRQILLKTTDLAGRLSLTTRILALGQ